MSNKHSKSAIETHKKIMTQNGWRKAMYCKDIKAGKDFFWQSLLIQYIIGKLNIQRS